MKGTNWNSATGEYTRIVHAETQEKANKANLLRLKYNASVKKLTKLIY